MNRLTLSLADYEPAVQKRLDIWQNERFAKRFFEKDYTLWSSDPTEISNRLGWLELAQDMQKSAGQLQALSQIVKAGSFTDVVLLGMGGSSLAPEVFQKTFGNSFSYPELTVLDSTHPTAIQAIEQNLNLEQTLFIISSKSGTTLETLSLFKYFWARSGQRAEHFIAITDPDTPLEKLANERRFFKLFQANPDVGGRFSALSHFGLVPASLIGMDVAGFIKQAQIMVESCQEKNLPQNPALILGAALGELFQAGRDKATFIVSDSLKHFPVWLEQLIAESTGKSGKGIVPIVNEPLTTPENYPSDRFFIHLYIENEQDAQIQATFQKLERLGHPVIQIKLENKLGLAQEIFRWEMAVAAAGAVLGIHPFNQPDVQLAKDLAKQAMQTPLAQTNSVTEELSIEKASQLKTAVQDWLSQRKQGDYIVIQAYLPPSNELTQILQSLRTRLRNKTGLATTLGYGPRFLHSTGQLHKGGPNNCLCLQIIDDVPHNQLPVPETDYTFGQLIQAQSLGDYQALKQKGRRVLRIKTAATHKPELEKITASLTTES